MNSEQLTAVLVALRKRMRGASIEEFDQMLDAQKALVDWGKGGFAGEMPFAEHLRRWNIQLPTASAAPAPQGASAQEMPLILERLRTLLVDQHPEAEAIEETFRQLRQWQDDGMSGPLPHAERLEKWAVWPPTASLSGDSMGQAPSAPPTDTAPHAASVPSESPSASASDPDDKFQHRYEDGLAALSQEDYYQARLIFRELRAQVSGRLAQPVNNAYVEASNKLQARTTQLIRDARNAERRFRGDTKQHVRAWEEVLKVNPDSTEANDALARLARSQADQEIERKLERTIERARAAAKSDQLPELNQLLGQVKAWRALGEKVPPEISPALYQRLVEGEKEVTLLRKETRDRLGESSTLLASGDHKEAYRRGRDLFERAVPQIVDVAGVFGPVGHEVNTREFFTRAREKFVSELRSLAAQRLSTAKGQEKEDPEQALETLDDAIARLTDSVLTPDDRAELKPDLLQVQEKRDQVQRRIEKYKNAQAKVIAARASGQTRSEVLKLLLQVEQEYPDYPSLKTYIQQAAHAVAQMEATDVATAIALARRQMGRDEHANALQTLADARKKAIQQVPNPPADSELPQRLQDVATLEREVAQAERGYRQMIDILSKVDDAIRRFDEGNERAIRTAGHLLDQFSESERRHQEVRLRWAELADRQSDIENWRSAQSEYQQQNWATAENMLRKVASGSSANKAEAARLADRARACQHAEEAAQAEQQSDLGTARSKYQDAANLLDRVGTDSLTAPVLEQCRQATARLAPLEESDREARRALQQAKRSYQAAQQQAKNRPYLRQKVEPIPEFATTVKLLEEARQKPSTLSAEINNLLQEARQAWRDTYLDGMKAALQSPDVDIPQKAFALAKELGSANLLFDRQEKQLARDLAVKKLDNEHEQLQNEHPVPWKKIETNRQNRLKIHRTPEAEAAHQDAVRERILAEVFKLKDPAAAKAYLAEELKAPALRGNEQLMAILIERHWEVGEWQEAEGAADDLAFHARNPALGDAWKGLTQAARWFKAGIVPTARAEIRVLRDRYQANAPLLDLVTNKERQLLAGARDQLLRKAGDAFARRTDDGYIEAAEQYAEAAQLDNRDPRILMGLQELGDKLGPGIRQRCTQADHLSIGQRPLADAVQEIERLRGTLNTIYKVFGDLRLDSDLKNRLDKAIKEITPKSDRWKSVQRSLKNADNQLNQALQNPQPLTGDTYSTGGWDFGLVARHLQEAQASARGDQECIDLAQKALDRLQKIEQKGRQLETRIKAFMGAWRDEEFQLILQEADQLAALWREAQRQADWDGLERLIRCHYPWHGRDVNTLEEHKRLTRQRQNNFQQWSRWSDAADASYKKARKAGLEIAKGLNELRNEHPLRQVIDLCEGCIGLCEQFADQLFATPDQDPLSQKAQAAHDKIPTNAWQNEVLGPTGYQTKASATQQAAKKGITQLTGKNGPLPRLRQIVNTQIQSLKRDNKAIPKGNIDRAKEALRKCEEIDPHHQEVAKLRNIINNTHSAPPPPKREGWWRQFRGQ